MKHKKKRRNCFLQIFSCCISKDVSNLETEFVSSSVQCDIQKEQTTISSYGEVNIYSDSEKMLDLAVYRSPPSKENTSLEKLGSSIRIRKNIHRSHQNTNLNKHDAHIQDFCHIAESGDVLKFNVSINSNTCIECLTRKGKNSLTIFDEANCELKESNSDIIIDKGDGVSPSKIRKNMDDDDIKNTDKTLEKVDQLQKKYFTLSSKVGRFSSNIMNRISMIKTDVDHLRALLYKIGCVVVEGKNSTVSFKFGEVKSSFDCVEEVYRDQALWKTEEYKYIQAKMRASHFCRFYNLHKLCNKKRRNKQRKH